MDLSTAIEVSKLDREIEICDEILENFTAEYKYDWVLYNHMLDLEVKVTPEMYTIFIELVKDKEEKQRMAKVIIVRGYI